MSFYSIAICPRCQRDCWQRREIVKREDGYVEEYSCFYDGVSIYLRPQARQEAE